MAVRIEVERGLARFIPPIAERLGLPINLEETQPPDRPAKYICVSLARSPHNQIVSYPAIVGSLRGRNYNFQLLKSDDRSADLQSQSIALLQKRLGLCSANFIFDESGRFLNEFPGLTRESLWTLEFAYTSHFENALRAAHDLPLGSVDLIKGPWYLLEFQAPSHLDMFKPYLHLFAHDPRYRIMKLSEFTGFVALAGDGDLISSAEHAVDYLEGIIDE